MIEAVDESKEVGGVEQQAAQVQPEMRDGGLSQITFDGDNVAALDSDRWVFMAGPGLDDPLVGLMRPAGTGAPNLYFYITDGQGRQLGAALSNGSLDPGSIQET